LPSPEETAPSPPRWALGELALLVAASLFALQFHARLPGRLPKDEDERGVAGVLQSEARPGDVVLLEPWWTERARLFAPDGLEVVGYLDDEGDDLDRAQRIWVLSQPNVPLGQLGAFHRQFDPGRQSLGPARNFGNLTLELYANGRARHTLFSATQSVAEAHVYLEDPGGARRECPFNGREHRCQGPDWLHVGAEWHEVNHGPKRCLWMHPPGGATKLVVELASVPAGELRLEAGYVWDRGAFHDNVTAASVGLDDVAAGQPLLSLSLPPRTETIVHAERVRTEPTSARIWAQADREDLRELCVELRVLEPKGVP
jgi:hypothetical protein